MGCVKRMGAPAVQVVLRILSYWDQGFSNLCSSVGYLYA